MSGYYDSNETQPCHEPRLLPPPVRKNHQGIAHSRSEHGQASSLECEEDNPNEDDDEADIREEYVDPLQLDSDPLSDPPEDFASLSDRRAFLSRYPLSSHLSSPSRDPPSKNSVTPSFSTNSLFESSIPDSSVPEPNLHNILPYNEVLVCATELISHVFRALTHQVSSTVDTGTHRSCSLDNDLIKCLSPSNDMPYPISPSNVSVDTFSDTTLEATAQRVMNAVTEAHYRKDVALPNGFNPQIHRHITIFAASDPDAVCSVALLKEGLSKRFGLNIHLIPISCYSHLRQAFTIEHSRSGKSSCLYLSSCIFFINVGSRRDIRNMMMSSVNVKRSWNPAIFIIDYHRPLSPTYFLKSHTNTCPCFIVCARSELDNIEENYSQLQRRRNRKPNEGDMSEEDEEELFVQTQPSQFVDRLGEYTTNATAFVLLEALRHHGLETPGMFFVVSISLAYHLLTGNLRRNDYVKQLRFLHEHFHHLRRHFQNALHDFQLFKTASKELLIPLLRFTSIEDALRNSVLFLRAQTVRFATPDIIEQELSALRVLLSLKEGAWKDQFRFLSSSQRKRLLQNALPDVLKRATLESRQSLPKRYPDDQETQYLTSTLAFVRTLSAVGLPDCISSIDVAFLALSLLSQPQPRQNKPISPTTSDLSTYYGLPELSPLGFLSESELLSNSGTIPSFYGRPFVDALQLIESLSNTTDRENTHQRSSSLSYDASASRVSSDQLGGSADATDVVVSFFGNIWDAYAGYGYDGRTPYVTCFSTSQTYQLLARLSRIALQLQRDITRFVLQILRKRRHGDKRDLYYRRAGGNIEGFLEDAVPQHLYHPLLLRYCASVMSDCIARGVMSACPEILLFVTAPPEYLNVGSTILGCSPAASIRTPSKLGLHLYHKLCCLKGSGMLENARQDELDASVAFIPTNKLHIAFSALFLPSNNQTLSYSFPSPRLTPLTALNTSSKDCSSESDSPSTPYESHTPKLSATEHSVGHRDPSSSDDNSPAVHIKRRRLIKSDAVEDAV